MYIHTWHGRDAVVGHLYATAAFANFTFASNGNFPANITCNATPIAYINIYVHIYVYSYAYAYVYISYKHVYVK